MTDAPWPSAMLAWEGAGWHVDVERDAVTDFTAVELRGPGLTVEALVSQVCDADGTPAAVFVTEPRRLELDWADFLEATTGQRRARRRLRAGSASRG